MLDGCSSLKKLNLINSKTNNVTNMKRRFGGCSSLKELNLTNFYINNATDMADMFYDCSYLLKEEIKRQFKNFKEEAFK